MTTLPSSLRRARASMTQSVAAAGGTMPPLPAQVAGDAPAPAPASAPQSAPAAPVQAAPVQAAPAPAPQPAPAAPVPAPQPAPVAPTNVVPLNPPATQPAPAAPVPAPQPAPVDPRFDAIQRELAALRQQNADLQAKVNAPAPEPEEPDFEVRAQAPQVSDEMRQTYRDAEPFVRAIATEVALSVVKQLLPEFNAVRKQAKTLAKDLDTRVTGVAKQTFEQSVAAQVPDLQTLMQDAQFAAYIDQPVPFMPGVTVRSVLSTAYRNQDIGPIVDAVRRFKEGRAPVAPAAAAAAAPDPNAFVQPVVAGGSRSIPTDTPVQQTLTASQRTADYRAFRAGTLSKADWETKQAAYDRAMIEGRFDSTK